jgi:hypothetical protein
MAARRESKETRLVKIRNETKGFVEQQAPRIVQKRKQILSDIYETVCTVTSHFLIIINLIICETLHLISVRSLIFIITFGLSDV